MYDEVLSDWVLYSPAIPRDLQKALPAEIWELSEHASKRQLARSWKTPRIVTVLSSNLSFDPAGATREGVFLPAEDYTSFEQQSAISQLPEDFQLKEPRKTMALNDLYHTYSHRLHDYSYR
jgi:hypothetical protein